MVFATHRDGSSIVATWEPRHRRFVLVMDGQVAMRARDVRVNRLAEYAWSETTELALRLRALAADLSGFLAVIARDRGFDAARGAAVLPDLGGWQCSSCGTPMIIAHMPGTVEPLQCPRCIGRRVTAERCSIALVLVLAEAQITKAIADEPTISRRTRDEVNEATAELRRLSSHLSSVGAGPAGSDADGALQ
jgi:hypothetical protein